MCASYALSPPPLQNEVQRKYTPKGPQDEDNVFSKGMVRISKFLLWFVDNPKLEAQFGKKILVHKAVKVWRG